MFSILDHSLRRPPSHTRVIGTLLGVRSEDGTEVEIRNCYAVPHTETAEQVEVDMEYQEKMLTLHLRANPREVLVGWYATSSELNTFSALIQNFYGQQGEGTWPHPAVHLTLSTVPGEEVDARTYISAPIGVTSERAGDSCLFIPVPHEIKYSDADKSGLEVIAGAKDREDRTAAVVTDIESLERAIEQVLEMINRVSNYVNEVLDEEAQPSSALGQFLMNALSLAPKVDPADIERDLYGHSLGKQTHKLTRIQQQPRPRHPRRLISRQHHQNTDRSIEPTSDRSSDPRHRRCPSRWRRRRRRRRTKAGQPKG